MYYIYRQCSTYKQTHFDWNEVLLNVFRADQYIIPVLQLHRNI